MNSKIMNRKGITMFVDTHCHINMLVKKEFDVPLQKNFALATSEIIQQAERNHVTRIINVGTSVIESENCIKIAQQFKHVWATIGTHPNDLTTSWMDDIKTYKKWLKEKELHQIVGIGEIGLDYHYPDFHKQRQYDALRAQIELALEFDVAIVIHTRDAGTEVLEILDEYKHDHPRGIIHCFSETDLFANKALELGFVLGIGGTLTYPKNNTLREIFSLVPLEKIVLETDAPFLPPQALRGKQNVPANIAIIAQALADLRGISVEEVGRTTTQTALELFRIE